MIDSIGSARGALAAPQASSTPVDVSPYEAIARLSMDDRTHLAAYGPHGFVSIYQSFSGIGYSVTGNAVPTGTRFASAVDAVSYAQRLGITSFRATTMSLPSTTPTNPYVTPFPAQPGLPQVSSEFPLTAADVSAQISAGRASVIEGVSRTGQLVKLYGTSFVGTGASRIESGYRSPETSSSTEFGSRNQYGEGVTRTPTTTRYRAWAVDEGPGPDHLVSSSQRGLEELVGEHGVTRFRVTAAY